MEYMIISMLTISIFTYIVYVLANRILAIQIHIKYLILCGCCAFFINSIFPRISIGFAGLAGTLGVITIFIIASSYFISFYYDNTMKKAAYESNVSGTSIEVPEKLQADENLGVEPDTHLRDRVELTESLECLTESVKVYYYPMKYEENNQHTASLKTYILNQQNNSEIIVKNVEFFTESVTKKYLYPALLKFSSLNQQHKPKVSPMKLLELDKKAEVFNNLMNLKNQKNMLAASLFSERNRNRNAAALESKELHSDLSPENMTSEVMDENCFPSPSDLDGLMDFAFSQKEQRNFVQALKAFRKALLLYPDSEVAPFLVMEIGTILKNLGSYNEAIKVFIEGRALVGVINNSVLEQEFINNIAYLRVVKNILIQNCLQFMPFNLIPEYAMAEINKEFSEWRNQS